MASSSFFGILVLGLIDLASSYRKLSPHGNYGQASEEEMRVYVEEEAETDMMLLGASGVLLSAALLHFHTGSAAWAKFSGIAGAAAATMAAGLLDEVIFGSALLIAGVVYGFRLVFPSSPEDTTAAIVELKKDE
eukprot:TRINITY_DN44464_c0_g1_i1.p1 TRINITY_DN44464_c0_g1~~TRINITY_DN44464_c0_g1_i1.p1  ORF type:complete len:134 (-),score=36.35 TRINITY_DN44464_c0_g1_i1:194-595(-)